MLTAGKHLGEDFQNSKALKVINDTEICHFEYFSVKLFLLWQPTSFGICERSPDFGAEETSKLYARKKENGFTCKWILVRLTTIWILMEYSKNQERQW